MEQEGRFLRYRANIPPDARLDRLPTEECCYGNPEQCSDMQRGQLKNPEVLPPFIPAPTRKVAHHEYLVPMHPGNSCRSILAEATFNHLAPTGWYAMSAGSQPTGEVHPRSLALLTHEGIDISGLHSKSWHELPVTPDVVIRVIVVTRPMKPVLSVWACIASPLGRR